MKKLTIASGNFGNSPKTQTQFISNNFFLFPKSCRLWDNLKKKHCRAGKATDDNMAHAHCMLDTLGYEHTSSKCSTYCFSSVKMVGRTTHNVTFYVHWLSYLIFMCHLWRDSTTLRSPDWYIRRINACSRYAVRSKGSGNNEILISVLDIRFIEDFCKLIESACLVRWWDT